MSFLMSSNKVGQPVGIIGAGSFGTAIANLLAYNVDVLLFSHKPGMVGRINNDHQNLGVQLSPRVRATDDIMEFTEKCTLIFPVVPSGSFRNMMRDFSPHLRPYHILIHGTKGFDAHGLEEREEEGQMLTREDVCTMSEVIMEESVVVRVGCLSGPNLASEIIEGQPTATVIGSHFDEVIRLGKKVLSSKHFHVFGTSDLLGAELAGAFKNVIAIGSGILKGKGMGKNIQAMLITRGLTEMVHFGITMGSSSSAFFGTAGIGGPVATPPSQDSPHFSFCSPPGRGGTSRRLLYHLVITKISRVPCGVNRLHANSFTNPDKRVTFDTFVEK